MLVADVDAAVAGALARAVARAVPVLSPRVPPDPAAELGRIGAPLGPGLKLAAGMRGAAAWRMVGAGPADSAGGPAESAVAGALDAVRPLLAERLLGALELTVLGLDLTGAPDLSGYLGQPPAGAVGFAHISGASEVLTAVALLGQLRPGAADLASSLTRQLAGHPLVVPLLAAGPGAVDEPSIAAAHGAAHLALAAAVASAVIGRGKLPADAGGTAAAVVGVAIGATVLLLRDTAMPAGYATALLEQVRQEYLLPRQSSGTVPVTGHRFALAEGEVPGSADFAANGLVTVVPGGAVIRTGIAEGSVSVLLTVSEQPPPLDLAGWDEVVEVSWHAAQGLASVTGLEVAGDASLCQETPPWPGDYRLRVHARGRDDADDDEYYELALWQTPAAPQIVHKRADRLGHSLRGEPAPDRPQPPERAYRWVKHTVLSEAATVTVVTGSTAEDVLRAFGADPARPRSLRRISEDEATDMTLGPWVAVLGTGSAVLAVEYNGYQGADEDVLCRASAGGRAASMFWNVNALTRLSFAEEGHVLAAFEPPDDIDAGLAVAAALDGLDFEDYRGTTEKGLVAVQRFTGHGITAQDLGRIEAADIAFRIAAPSPQDP
jgi:hypothetical protein